MIKSNRGQLSIFMGITLILVMGMLAFIVNVGLFVKAKINLQNAVDAAAFAGAATQARQLTNIAYVNWEMRNTYKEWMFKYYVLGQMGLVKGNNNLSDANLAGSGRVSFLLKNPGDAAGSAASIGYDRFNIPTICVHNNSSTDICPIYALPGIPRFPAIGVAGISDIHEAFVNKLVQEKASNCSTRTKMNFLASLSWAYSSGIKEIPGAPLIATNRAGAWPEALELGMRIRNLEMIINRPPVANLDFNGMNALAGTAPQLGLNERPVKAFMSAFRNLGGGKYKDKLAAGGNPSAGEGFDELAATFRLTEVAPQPFQASEMSVSGFLIPPTFTYLGETSVTALTKHYLDLQVMPVNLATMFTTFVPGGNEFESNVQSESNCRVSKSAMPVPGYLMGFVKNPAVLTYYAVKGEAEFTGLFFPRLSEDQPRSFKLTAYAAAKPFGGRIGPKLFGFIDGDKTVVPREDSNARSSSYVGGVDIPLGNFVPGMPIPSSQSFWVNQFKSNVGGVPGTGQDVTFAIPNLIYNFDTIDDLNAQSSGGVSTIQTIAALPYAGSSTSEIRGLYNSYQMREFKKALGGTFAGQNMTSDDLMKAFVTSRQATRYDAVNYLIPDFHRVNEGNHAMNAAPTVRKIADAAGGKGFYYKLFAPLVGQNLLYTNAEEVGGIVITYMKANDKAIQTYLEALLQVGQSIFNTPSGKGTTTNLNAEAAQSIHVNAGISTNATPADLVSADPFDPTAPTCKNDMASKFNHFFRKSKPACGIVPLEMLMVEYIEKRTNNPDGKLYYTTTYLNELKPSSVMTAYYPGARQGTSPGSSEALTVNPIGAAGTTEYSTRRNYYSTKFVPLAQFFESSSSYKQNVFLESDVEAPADIQNITQQNPINQAMSQMNGNYFLDF